MLLEILGDEYLSGAKSNIEIFDEVKGLDEDDLKELLKFSLVEPGILADAPNMEINKEMMALFSYKNTYVGILLKYLFSIVFSVDFIYIE